MGSTDWTWLIMNKNEDMKLGGLRERGESWRNYEEEGGSKYD